jgi:hypothetical protein
VESKRGYLIRIRGSVGEGDLNRMSPVRLRVLEHRETCTLLEVKTDQSGLIGLLRHLHGLGFSLLSVKSKLMEK